MRSRHGKMELLFAKVFQKMVDDTNEQDDKVHMHLIPSFLPTQNNNDRWVLQQDLHFRITSKNTGEGWFTSGTFPYLMVVNEEKPYHTYV